MSESLHLYQDNEILFAKGVCVGQRHLPFAFPLVLPAKEHKLRHVGGSPARANGAALAFSPCLDGAGARCFNVERPKPTKQSAAARRWRCFFFFAAGGALFSAVLSSDEPSSCGKRGPPSALAALATLEHSLIAAFNTD